MSYYLIPFLFRQQWHSSPFHSGGHVGDYFSYVNGLIANLQTNVENATAPNLWSENQLLAQIGDMEQTIKAKLLDPNDPLKLQIVDTFKI
ncbi:MAG: hypothetical protein IPN76_17825 [Saprospiraceae bacterium]|nr:hypothetical protein [Saprospiraceae bacterium]